MTKCGPNLLSIEDFYIKSNKVSFADQSVEERCDASDILYNLLWIASVSTIVKSKLCESRVTMQTDSRTAQVQD